MSAQESPLGKVFGRVADAYDRARPSYPTEAVSWLAGRSPVRVLELGAGTGKLTSVLHAEGHQVLATDPLPEMLSRLREHVAVPHVVAGAEHIPLRSRSVDVVVCGQSFHWFDHDVAMAEIARVLRPGGILAVVWNTYDVGIPWVKRLRKMIGPERTTEEAVMPLMESPYFGFVEHERYRFWQPHTADTLLDLARSVSRVAALDEHARSRVLHDVEKLYADYGRGPDGMQVPWLTECYRAVVRHQELPPEAPPPAARQDPGAPETGDAEAPAPPDDPGMQLIDFR
ncbi:MAG TPA: methyltransferase domain-containing protein [Marmoricola sp.]|nr:methyltransferase domain-containing protein [Marmoricola sp.]